MLFHANTATSSATLSSGANSTPSAPQTTSVAQQGELGIHKWLASNFGKTKIVSLISVSLTKHSWSNSSDVKLNCTASDLVQFSAIAFRCWHYCQLSPYILHNLYVYNFLVLSYSNTATSSGTVSLGASSTPSAAQATTGAQQREWSTRTWMPPTLRYW